jgi:hypothetical protein
MDITCGHAHEPEPDGRPATPGQAPAGGGGLPATAGEPGEHAGGSLPQTQTAQVWQEPDHRPSYVIVAWVSEQLRDKIQRNGASLAQALQATGRTTPGPVPERSDSAGA